jgi:hypothetical protein
VFLCFSFDLHDTLDFISGPDVSLKKAARAKTSQDNKSVCDAACCTI